MAIPDNLRRDFASLVQAGEIGALAPEASADVETGEPRYVIRAVEWANGDYVLIPFGHLHDGDPSEACRRPERPATH